MFIILLLSAESDGIDSTSAWRTPWSIERMWSGVRSRRTSVQCQQPVFSARQHTLSALLCYRPSVCPPVTRV